jgi:signal transduction histidine kinase
MTLWLAGQSLHLTVKDSGIGFDPDERRGLGLVSMEERVRAVNGNLSVRSKPGDGTHVEVHIPVPAEEAGSNP